METELLQSFRAVVRAGSFSAAAHERGYAQSSITAHVQALEHLLRARLLDRLPSGVVLTEAGQRLLPRAEDMLAMEQQLHAEVTQVPGQIAGTVRIAAAESLCAYRLPSLIMSLRRAYPGIRLELSAATTTTALASVRDGTSNAALIIERNFRAPDLQSHQLADVELVLLASPAKADLPAGTWADLREEDFLLLEEGCSYSDESARQLGAAGQPSGKRFRFGSIEAVKRCVAAGQGLTVLPRLAATDELRSHTLAELTTDLFPTCTALLVTNPKRTQGPAAQAALQHVAAQWGL